MGGPGFSLLSLFHGSGISAGVESEDRPGRARVEIDTSGAGTRFSSRLFCAVCAGDSSLRAEQESDDKHVAVGIVSFCVVVSDSDTASCEMETDVAMGCACSWLGGSGAVFSIGEVSRWKRIFPAAQR